jgi:hypothetical protein
MGPTQYFLKKKTVFLGSKKALPANIFSKQNFSRDSQKVSCYPSAARLQL